MDGSLGPAARLVAGAVVNREGEAVTRDMALGFIDALVSGFTFAGFGGVSGLGPRGMPMSMAGPIIASILSRVCSRRTDRLRWPILEER